MVFTENCLKLKKVITLVNEVLFFVVSADVGLSFILKFLFMFVIFMLELNNRFCCWKGF